MKPNNKWTKQLIYLSDTSHETKHCKYHKEDRKNNVTGDQATGTKIVVIGSPADIVVRGAVKSSLRLIDRTA